ncbi:hypothetical protein F442_13321 [Phytophthora nicotianae P10297]|uniref:Uncharacterized protein n=1 Tax=Phytophthora nicotianae P10297 TaxID=1317064 RepID=W2YZ41_PHYNI|nr:hypothetical protein F442_13321 [Phytophthora nicotianae P10297]
MGGSSTKLTLSFGAPSHDVHEALYQHRVHKHMERLDGLQDVACTQLLGHKALQGLRVLLPELSVADEHHRVEVVGEGVRELRTQPESFQ